MTGFPAGDWANSHRSNGGVLRNWGSNAAATAPVTFAIVGLCVVVHILSFLSKNVLVDYALIPAISFRQPVRLVTSMFLHSSITHLLCNMVSLVMLGVYLERLLGAVRYLSVFILTGLVGSIFCLFLTDYSSLVGSSSLLLSPITLVVGASGAIFGLFGVLGVIQYLNQRVDSSFLTVLALNAIISFTVPNIAWQGHLGGFIAGVICGFILKDTLTRSYWQPRGRINKHEIIGLVTFVLVMAVLCYGRYLIALQLHW